MDQPGAKLAVEWITDLDRIRGLEGTWRDLESRDRLRSAFATWNWRLPWYEFRASGGEQPLVGIARRGERVVGIAPLIVAQATQGSIPVRRLSSAGYQTSEGDFLLDDPEPAEVARALLKSCYRAARADVLTILVEESAGITADVMKEVARSLRLPVASTSRRVFVVSGVEDYDAYYRARSSAFRRNLSSRARHMEALGEVRMETIGNGESPELLRAAAQRMFVVANRSWKLKGEGSMDARWQGFFESAILTFGACGLLRLYLLRIGDRDIAYFIAVREGDVLYDVAVGFDDEFRRYAPGIHLTQEIIRAMPADGLRTLVSHGDHEYKVPWATSVRMQEEITIAGPGPRGRLAHWLRFTVAPFLARIRRRRSAQA